MVTPILSDIMSATLLPATYSIQSVKKVAGCHFFEFFRVTPLAFAPGRQNPKVFIRSDVHAVRAGIKLKGQPPLNNPRVYRQADSIITLSQTVFHFFRIIFSQSFSQGFFFLRLSRIEYITKNCFIQLYQFLEHFSASMARTNIRTHRALSFCTMSSEYVSVQLKSSFDIVATRPPKLSNIE